jgi:hypothetical protein
MDVRQHASEKVKERKCLFLVDSILFLSILETLGETVYYKYGGMSITVI